MWTFYAKYISVMSKPFHIISASKSASKGQIKLLNFHRQSSTSNFLGHCCSTSHLPILSTRTLTNSGAMCYANLFNKCTEYLQVTYYGVSKRNFSHGHTNHNQVNRSKPKKPKLEMNRPDEVVNKLHFNPKEWKTIYRFKYIRVARVIQKIKIYQTGFTCCLALPSSLGCFLYETISPEAVGFMAASSVLACGMLYVMGRFCSRLVGIIYTSTTDDTLVRIAHLNFWGKREDRIFSKTEFIPFSELPDNVSDIYVNLRFYTDPDTKLHLCVRYGTVYDKLEFEDIFGAHTGLEIVEKSANQSNGVDNAK